MTPKQIEKLVAGCYPIEHHPGLRLEVRKGRRSWTLRRRALDGKLKQEVVGHYPAMSLMAAVSACEAIRAAGWGRTKPAVVTVNDVLDAYAKGHLRVRRRNPEPTIALLWRHTRSLATLDAGSIDRRAAHAHFVMLRDRPATAKTLKHLLVASWHYAMDAGLLPDGGNPWARVATGITKPRSRVLDDHELRALLAWLPVSKLTVGMQDILILTLATAARSGECVSIAWSDVDLEAQEWHLRGPKTKTGAGRVVPLNAVALEVLRRRQAVTSGGVWVFPSGSREGTHVLQHTLVNALCERRETCPVTDWTAHDLRRSARTGFSKLGCPPDIGERLVGHAVGGVRGTYDLYAYAREQREWLELWGSHLQSLRGAS